jgi:flagellar hook protein FlgE
MASTTALFTGLTGLNANARNLDVVANNIANVNTTAFKQSRLMFSTMFSRTINAGSSPAETTGGTNPFQIGLGVATSGTQRMMTNGTTSVTGDQRDMAIDGGGMFVVQRGESQLYTRAGAFRQNSRSELTTINGDTLLGYGVDSDFGIDRGTLRPLSVPVGQLTVAEQTTSVRLAGNLNANGALPTSTALINLLGSATDGLRALPGATPPPAAGNVLETTTRLLDVEDPTAGGAPLFAAGQTLELRNVSKGDKQLPTSTLAVTATTTMADLATFFQDALGIDPTIAPGADGRTPGVTLDATTGTLRVVGNTGSQNDLTIEGADVRLLASNGSLARFPFVPSKQASSSGESTRTTLVAYDSLGTALEVDATFVLESRGNAGTTWRYFIDSADASTLSPRLATGTLSFDTSGALAAGAPITVSLPRDGTGGVAPMTFTVAFGGGRETLTALTDTRSQVAATFRDGSPIGTLTTFGVGPDGVLTGSFSNGLTRTLGQVVLATFVNPEGLVEEGNNLYSVGANSGAAVVVEPGTFSAGRVLGGSLEMSNVDLGEEFIKMIQSQTGYSANSRVIRTADELMQQLLVLGR